MESSEVNESVSNQSEKVDAPLRLKLMRTHNSEEIMILYDSGSSDNFIPAKVAKELGLTVNFEEKGKGFVTYNEEPLTIIGKTRLDVVWDENGSRLFEFYVVDENTDEIILNHHNFRNSVWIRRNGKTIILCLDDREFEVVDPREGEIWRPKVIDTKFLRHWNGDQNNPDEKQLEEMAQGLIVDVFEDIPNLDEKIDSCKDQNQDTTSSSPQQLKASPTLLYEDEKPRIEDDPEEDLNPSPKIDEFKNDDPKPPDLKEEVEKEQKETSADEKLKEERRRLLADLKKRIKEKMPFSTEQEKQLDNIFEYIAENNPIAPDPKKANKNRIMFSVHLKNGQYFRQPRRNFQLHLKEEIRKQLKKMLELGLIERIDEKVAKCISNITVVRKSNGELRVCIDYRQLNKLVETDEDDIDCVVGITDQLDHLAKWFVVLDINAAYHHVLMDPKYKDLVCFYGVDGEVYTWNTMAFGHKNAPNTFTKWVHSILKLEENKETPGYPTEGIPKESNQYPRYAALSYLDDLLLEARTVDQLLLKLDYVTKLLIENGVSINLKKIQMGDNVKFLGAQRVRGGLLNDPEKMRSLKLEFLKSKEDLKSVLGLLRFLAPSVPMLAEKLVKFNKMTSKEYRFVWNEDLQKELQAICDSVSENTMRYIPDYKKPFFMYVDASKIGCGGFLYQLSDDKVVQPIMFFSKGFNKQSLNWHVGEKECYGLVFALLKCRRFIEFGECIIFTDHRSLLYMTNGMKNNTISPKVHRWMSFLLSFNLKLVHVSGEENFSDPLSRFPLIADTET
jgi:hypothetical protein